MTRRGIIGMVALAALIATPVARAGPTPDPGRTLRDAARNLSRAGSYRVQVDVHGGVAQGEDHRVIDRVASESYRAEVIQGVTKVQAPRAFRSGNGGAVEHEGRWVNILATSEGTKLNRLFTPVERIVAEALDLRRLAEFDPDGPTVASDGTDGDDRPARGSGSSARGADSEDGEDGEVRSRLIRVEGPQEVALDRFIRIQNSGCMSEG